MIRSLFQMAHPYSIRASALTTVRALLVMGAVTKLSNGLSDQEDGGLPHPFSSKINIISRYKRKILIPHASLRAGSNLLHQVEKGLYHLCNLVNSWYNGRSACFNPSISPLGKGEKADFGDPKSVAD